MPITRRIRRPTFAGGLSRWVTPDEARAIAERVDACELASDLLVAAYGPAILTLEGRALADDDLRPVSQYAWSFQWHRRIGSPTPLVAIDHDRATSEAVAHLAARRRHRAIRTWAEAHRRDVRRTIALLALCPACGARVEEGGPAWELYCPDHRDHERSEARRLAGRDNPTGGS